MVYYNKNEEWGTGDNSRPHIKAPEDKEVEVIEDYTYSVETVPSDIGWFRVELPPTAIARLKTYIKKPENVSATKNLAGNISYSYYLKDVDDWFFKNYVEFMCKDYKAWSSYFDLEPSIGQHNNDKHPYMLDSLWVNHQKQHEFNPSHIHAGIYSFVIFMKIPTKWEEQHALPFSENSNAPRASDFSFEYLNGYGKNKVETFLMSSDWENSMLFFPANLRHAVYPFYNCDEERITISGNIGYNTNVKLKTDEEITEDLKKRGLIG
jgi:hypothetical protein